MNQTVAQKNKRIDLLMILAFLVVARICCPALSNLPFFSMAFTFVYGVAFLGLYLLLYPKVNKGEFGVLMSVGLYTIFVVGKSLILGRGLFSTDAFNAYVIVFLTVIFFWSRRQTEEKRKLLLGLILLAFCFNYVYSIWVLTKDPGASRNAAATSVLEKSSADILNAVGSFDAVYGGISVVAIFLFMLRNMEKKDKKKWLIAALLVLALVFIYMAEYATALVLLMLTIALVFSSRNLALSGLLFFSFVLILVYHEAVGQWVIDLSSGFSGSEMIRVKMQDFGKMFKTFEATGTYGGLDGRAARMQWSFDSFLADPLFGGYGKAGNRIGGHSELLDMLGKYGLLGFGLFITFFASLYSEIKRGLQNPEMKKCCTIVFLVWVITAVLNPALFSLQMVPMILLLPLTNVYVRQDMKLSANNGQENCR